MVVLALAAQKRASADEPKHIYQRTMRATVLVKVKVGDKTGTGSGWVVNREKGLIITNYHVIENGTQVQVFLPIIRGGRVLGDQDLYKKEAALVVRVLASNPRCDLALLQLVKPASELAELKLAAQSPEPGERVHSIGNPGASCAFWVYTQGHVRQVAHRQIHLSNQTINTLLVEIQSPINPGDSGGPLVNDRGELVGVVAATNRNAQLFGLAIDVTRVRQFLDECAPGKTVASSK